MKRLFPRSVTLAASALAVVLFACSSSSDDANTGSGDEDLTAAKSACQNKSCGDTCSICNGKPGCVETAVVKQCNAQGKCSATIDKCEGAYKPCANKACGAECSICPPNDPTCVETQVIKLCDAAGKCAPSVPQCGGGGGGDAGAYQPCGGKKCGDTCNLCPPNDPGCVETAVIKMCDGAGKCAATVPQCGSKYQPCGGKKCGDTCTICDPADPGCVETAVLKQCQPDGACTPSVATCK